jgi:hypothetical protein
MSGENLARKEFCFKGQRYPFIPKGPPRSIHSILTESRVDPSGIKGERRKKEAFLRLNE